MTIEPSATSESGTLFLLTCRDCWPEFGDRLHDCALPFLTAEARGRWASAHTEATGHVSWWVLDVR